MPKVVTVFSKKGCHLCERVIEALRTLSPRYDLEVRVVDITLDAKLTSKYLLTVPVVQVEGREVFDASKMTADSSYVARLERAISG